MSAPSARRITELFAPLAVGDFSTFYNNVVADNVDWTVLGTHPLAGRYTSKADFLGRSVATMGKALDGPMLLHVKQVTGGGGSEWAVVELELAKGTRCRNGMAYENQYAWVTRWEGEMIVEVRVYLDSNLLNQALEVNK
jgi:uncharacterized protein